MLKALLIVLALGLTASTASAQQAYTLKKVCNGRTCYYVKVPVNTTSYSTPTAVASTPTQAYTLKKVCNNGVCYYVRVPVASYNVPVVSTTVRNRPILGGAVVNSQVVGVQTTVVETLPTVAPKVSKATSTVEVPELELLNL